jgi:O-phosphoseryl-tRNA(Cys) synthetase
MLDETTIQNASKNPHVQAAAVALLALIPKHPDNTDEYADEAGGVLERCHSLMGLPHNNLKLTRKQQSREDSVTEAIQGMADERKRVLVGARILSKHN